MHTGYGTVVEVVLRDGLLHARINCPKELIPAPGQYLLAGSASFPDLLPVSLFSTESTPQGFTTSAPIPETWTPGLQISLRGPLGSGFRPPPSVGKAALIAVDSKVSRLYGLIVLLLKQRANVVLVSDSDTDFLPDEVEAQPFSSLNDVLRWADYVAIDVSRENIPGLKDMLNGLGQAHFKGEAQVLVYTSMPCGGVAKCGVCAVTTGSDWRRACEDGPVFQLKDI